jgi:hypothetical protein
VHSRVAWAVTRRSLVTAGGVASPAAPCQFFKHAYQRLSVKGQTLTPMCIDGVGWVARCVSSSSRILANRLPLAVAMLPRVIGQQMFIVGQSTQGSRLDTLHFYYLPRCTTLLLLDLGASSTKVPTEKYLEYEYSVIAE